MANEKMEFHETPPQQFSGNVATIYCNGSIVSVGVADMSALFLLDTLPVLKVNLSYTSAKNLLFALQQSVDLLEKATDHTIMRSEEVEKGLREAAEESKSNV